MEGFGILRAQFKDLADFDAADDFDGCTAVRAFVAGDHVADGRDRHVFEVPRRIDVLIVIAGLIGTGYAIGDVHGRRIDEDEERFIIRFIGTHGAHVARLEAVGLQFVFRRRFDDIAADEILDGDVIDFMVAADHAEDRLFASIVKATALIVFSTGMWRNWARSSMVEQFGVSMSSTSLASSAGISMA